MDLVDEEDVAGVEIGQQGRQVPGLLDGGAGGDPDIDPHLVGDDPRQGGLAQARGAVEQHVIQGLIPAEGRLDVDRQILLGLLLAGVVPQGLGPQGELSLVQGGDGGRHHGGFIILRKVDAHSQPSYFMTMARRP